MDEIVLQIQAGHTELYADLWEQKWRLIKKWAREYYNYLTLKTGISFGTEFEDENNKRRNTDDFLQAGFFGLVDAVKHYDPEKGSFNTLLKWYIRQAFQQEITGRTRRRILEPIKWSDSLDIPIFDDSEETYADFVPDTRDDVSEADERIYQEQLHNALEKALDTLPEKQAAAIRSEFWEGRTLQQTADLIGVSLEQVRQFRESGLHRIRYSSSRRQLEQFVDLKTNFYIHNGLRPTENNVVQREHMRTDYKIRVLHTDFLE